MEMQTWALLPIKEHSERVKKKNFRLLAGKPLYEWVIESLLKASNIAGILVNTDSCLLIEELNKKYPSIKTMFRPQHLQGDFVSMNEIIAHDINCCKDQNIFLQTHVTNPLLSSKTIDMSIEKYFNSIPQYDSALGVNRIQARTYWPDGRPINHELGILKRTQDLVPVFEENSNIFLFSRSSFESTGSRIGKRPYLIEMPKNEAFEIDDEEDFKLVDIIMKSMCK